jgi:hypothetical protein
MILEGLMKKVEDNKCEWPDLLNEIIWIYHHTLRNYTIVPILSGVWYESSHPDGVDLTFSAYDQLQYRHQQ